MQYSERFNYWLKPEEAKALEAEEKGREMVSFKIADLADAINDAIKKATGVESAPFHNPATGIPYNVAHPTPPPLAGPKEPYDAIRARTAAHGDSEALLAVHAAYLGETPQDAKNKAKFELPHHDGVPPFKCYPKAVMKCAKQLGIKVRSDGGVVPTAHPEAYGNTVAKEHIIQHLDEIKAQNDALTQKARREVARLMKQALNEHGADTYGSPVGHGAISYDEAHPNGTPTAPEGTVFDAKAEVAKAEAKGWQALQKMHAYYNGGADPNDSKNYLYPHHLGSGAQALVPSAVRALAAKFNISTVPGEGAIPTQTKQETQFADAGVQGHVVRHLQQMGELSTAGFDTT